VRARARIAGLLPGTGPGRGGRRCRSGAAEADVVDGVADLVLQAAVAGDGAGGVEKGVLVLHVLRGKEFRLHGRDLLLSPEERFRPAVRGTQSAFSCAVSVLAGFLRQHPFFCRQPLISATRLKKLCSPCHGQQLFLLKFYCKNSVACFEKNVKSKSNNYLKSQ